MSQAKCRDMSLVKQINHEVVKYPFLNEIVQCNHHYLYKFQRDMDFDTYIVLMNLYLYTCKYMNENNMELTKENIYNNMEYLFSNSDFRIQLINTFNNFNKSLTTSIKTKQIS